MNITHASHLNNGSIVKSEEVPVELPEAIQVDGVDRNVNGDFMMKRLLPVSIQLELMKRP